MPVAAAVLTVVWFLVAFVLRTVIQVRRHRDSGVRLDAGPPLSLGWWAKVLLVASVVMLAAAPVLAATGRLAPVAVLDGGAVAVAGLVAAVAGIAVTFWAQLAMGASWRIGVDPAERTALVTAGPFATVRNPIFSAMALTGVGLTSMAPTVVGLGGLAVLFVALEIQVRGVEEPHLARIHGAAYADYAGRTGRFVPRATRAWATR
jgi:protein-S-isoprenylcysteine O-methyltransferase Ste14